MGLLCSWILWWEDRCAMSASLAEGAESWSCQRAMDTRGRALNELRALHLLSSLQLRMRHLMLMQILQIMDCSVGIQQLKFTLFTYALALIERMSRLALSSLACKSFEMVDDHYNHLAAIISSPEKSSRNFKKPFYLAPKLTTERFPIAHGKNIVTL